MVEEKFEGLKNQFDKIGDAGKKAAEGTGALVSAISKLSGFIAPGYVGGYLTKFISNLGLASEAQKKWLGVTFESTEKLRLFTTGLGTTIGGLTSYLDMIDKVERKQSELNKVYGIGAISITDYYRQLVTATGMGGKAAHESAETLIKSMREQREGTEQEINAILPLFIKYSVGISKSFPQDFIFMHERLGMGMDKIADTYETIAANAAIARVPLDLYKNTIFSLSAEFHQYGLSTDAAIRLTNLFTDDVAKNTLTMNEAQSAARAFTQMQFTAGGFGERVRASMFLRKAMAAGEVPSGLRESLEETTRAQYGPSARFAELNAMQMQYMLSRLDPKVFAQVTGVAMTESMKNIPKEMRPQIFPQFWGGMEYRFFQERLGGALKTGGGDLVSSVTDVMKGIEPTTKEAINAINALRKQIEQNTKDMREWYYPLSQFMDWLRSQGFGAGAGVAGAAISAAPGAAMMYLALRGATGLGGGAIAGGAGVGGLLTGAAGVVGPLAVFTGALIDAGLVVKAFSEGIKLSNENQRQKQMLLESAETPGGKGFLLSQAILAQEALRIGKTDIAKKALQEARMYQPQLTLPLPSGMEDVMYKGYETEAKKRGQVPLSFEAIRKAALAGLSEGVPVLIVKVDKGVVATIVDDKFNKINKPNSPIQVMKE